MVNAWVPRTILNLTSFVIREALRQSGVLPGPGGRDGKFFESPVYQLMNISANYNLPPSSSGLVTGQLGRNR
jgi:hypothetical protein